MSNEATGWGATIAEAIGRAMAVNTARRAITANAVEPATIANAIGRI
jgi:hypothetical protein